MTPENTALVEMLGDVLDLIAAAESEFARTDKHHAFYGERHAAVQQARETITTLEKRVEILTEALREIRDVTDAMDSVVSALPSMRETLSDCAEFLADLDGDLARRCEDMLAKLHEGGE